MNWIKRAGYYSLRSIGLVFVLVLVLTTMDYLYSGPKADLLLSFKMTAVFTFSCAFFCFLFMVTAYETIFAFPRLIFYALFALIVTAGVLLGDVTGYLILRGRLMLPLNNLIFSLTVGLISSAVVSGYFHTRENIKRKMDRLREVEIENEKLRRMESEARLNDLRAKLKPHFLFNVLNTTAALIYDDPAKAEQSIVRLSGMYRKVLSISGQTLVPIGEELELVEDYLELEKLRFDEKLSYEIVCPDELKKEKIPGLLIEPLVENALKHNQEHLSRALKLRVTIEERDAWLFIAVEDDGRGFDVERAGFGFGLFSIQERLRLLYGNGQAFDIVSRKDRGTTVSIRIPAGQS